MPSRRNLDPALFAFVSFALCFYVVVYPFAVVRYPPLIDLHFTRL